MNDNKTRSFIGWDLSNNNLKKDLYVGGRRIKYGKRKLIDIGLCLLSRDMGKLGLDGTKDIGGSRYLSSSINLIQIYK